TGFVYYRVLSPLIGHHPETLALVFRSDDSEISVYKIRNHSAETRGQTDIQRRDSAVAIVAAQKEKQGEIIGDQSRHSVRDFRASVHGPIDEVPRKGYVISGSYSHWLGSDLHLGDHDQRFRVLP